MCNFHESGWFGEDEDDEAGCGDEEYDSGDSDDGCLSVLFSLFCLHTKLMINLYIHMLSCVYYNIKYESNLLRLSLHPSLLWRIPHPLTRFTNHLAYHVYHPSHPLLCYCLL